ncbi:MAG: 2-succinyl-5-enolpyruvyl-6-hydroxy-3-cyclohexene-1-carboxylic-acid synthase [Bacteroidia bacterium]
MSNTKINALYQTLANVIEVFHRHGVANVVLSPGSRSAPLALSVLRSQKFDCFEIVDERSAAYFALGLAKSSGRPTMLLCTSGTAVYNYAPAVAEAFFQELPLIVCTADRPPELIAQNDNQAIYQQNIFGQHVLSFTQMPNSYEIQNERKWAIQKANEACILAYGNRQGPVHLNFPFSEPFYPNGNEPFEPNHEVKAIGKEQGFGQLNNMFLNDVKAVIDQSQKVWIIGGMCIDVPNASLIEEFAENTAAQLFFDPLCNLHLSGQLYFFDAWLKNEKVEAPDFIISFGNHFLSKSLKQFIRENPPAHHLHVSEHDQLADPFSSINFMVKSHVDDFFAQLNEFSFSPKIQTGFNVFEQQYKAKPIIDPELSAAQKVLQALPNDCVLHLGNSTPVRYLLQFGYLLKNKGITVFANRGTSGIDGSVSTAVGMAQDDDRPHFLIIGDLSMYYDRNGLWHKYVPQNFKIIVVNNNGGGIFKRINGAKSQFELNEYFVNPQPTNFKALANAHDFEYVFAEENTHLNQHFLKPNRILFELKV